MKTESVEQLQKRRQRMVETQIAGRGVDRREVLEAMSWVPRELFVPAAMVPFAYDDTPLPIEGGQTISQPIIVATMVAALDLEPSDRVLEIGTGSGYAAAVLGRLAREVFTIERNEELARLSARRLDSLGMGHVQVRHGDGTLGWPEQAPFDAIVVAAGGPGIPTALLDQLAVGGRLVIPVGSDVNRQQLRRVVRDPEGLKTEDLGPVAFVPLIGEQAWRRIGDRWQAPPDAAAAPSQGPERGKDAGRRRETEKLLRRGAAAESERQRSSLVQLLREESEPFSSIEGADLGSLIERIGHSRLVLMGESSHGTSEFYRFRSRLSRELIERHGFDFVAVEADWPDAARIDTYVRHLVLPAERSSGLQPAFTRFPTWMWRNEEVVDFVKWLHAFNGEREAAQRVSFHGLDIYSLYRSLEAVLRYLDDIDPAAAAIARLRYGCLTPWQRDPALYGQAVLSRQFETCERAVVTTLVDLLKRRTDYLDRDGDRFWDAVHNARVVAAAEAYYRIMYYGSRESWNLRDQHMFDTLRILLDTHGEQSRGIVWAHNSHLGDAIATDMAARGEHNVGQLTREQYGDDAFLIGFGTDHGSVAAAHGWDLPMEVMALRPAHLDSYERLFHETGLQASILHLREPGRLEVRQELSRPRLERAVGVIYRPETELQSHYFHAVLPWQFDEYVWFDRTSAIKPLPVPAEGQPLPTGVPETYPFGL